jgi:hypothetical protein
VAPTRLPMMIATEETKEAKASHRLNKSKGIPGEKKVTGRENNNNNSSISNMSATDSSTKNSNSISSALAGIFDDVFDEVFEEMASRASSSVSSEATVNAATTTAPTTTTTTSDGISNSFADGATAATADDDDEYENWDENEEEEEEEEVEEGDAREAASGDSQSVDEAIDALTQSIHQLYIAKKKVPLQPFSIHCGRNFTYILTKQGIYCMGENNFSQLGSNVILLYPPDDDENELNENEKDGGEKLKKSTTTKGKILDVTSRTCYIQKISLPPPVVPKLPELCIVFDPLPGDVDDVSVD